MNYSNYHLGKYWYSPQTNTLYWRWLDETENASWEMMREAMIQYAEFAEETHASYHIVDERDLHFTYIPEIQDWLDAHITIRIWKAGCKCFALVRSQNIFIEVAVKQIFEEVNAQQITMQIFDTVENAEQWILSLASTP